MSSIFPDSSRDDDDDALIHALQSSVGVCSDNKPVVPVVDCVNVLKSLNPAAHT